MKKDTNSGDWNSGKWNSGDWNSGDWNSGDWNSGDWNSGDWNSGDWNSGDWNNGNRNAGNCNSGYWNSGNRNAGNCNSGNWNSGNRNAGNWNSGNWNSGNCNSGDWNNGYCNSVTPEDCLIFNKPAKRSDWHNADKPDWIYVCLTEWVCEEDMKDSEKEAFPSYVTTGGYLKCYTSLKHAYIEAWEKASDDDKEKTFKLPNFDIEVFKEVFGFTPTRPARTREVTLALTDEQIDSLKEQGILKGDK